MTSTALLGDVIIFIYLFNNVYVLTDINTVSTHLEGDLLSINSRY